MAKKQKVTASKAIVTKPDPDDFVPMRPALSAPVLGPEHAHDHKLRYGTPKGNTFHAVTVKSFPSMQAYDEHRKATGLTFENKGNKQQFLSRRGSVSEFKVNLDHTVDTVRVSSAPTSRALERASKTDALAAYDATAEKIELGVTNSKGKQTTTNVVQSESFTFKHQSGKGFQFAEPPQFAQGTSATGLPASVDQVKRRKLYRASIDTAKKHGLTPTPALNYHSEPMALSLMAPITRGSVVMTTSSPNDMCVNCGRTYADHLESGTTVSAMGGRSFGGQHAGFDDFSRHGDIPSSSTGAQIFRATPTEELRKQAVNRQQVSALFESAPKRLKLTDK